MCYSPTLIPNPNYGQKQGFSFLKDCVSKFIPIPCGHCGECVRLRANSIVQRCQLEELYGWPFFCSLSYNPESLPVHVCSNGVPIKYADYKDVQNMMKRLRNRNAFGRRFRYFGVTEFGSKKGRPHVHIIWFFERLPEDNAYTPLNLLKEYWPIVLKEWQRNYGSSRSPLYRPLLTYKSRFIGGKLNSTYDFHFIQPSVNGTSDDVSFYITKYLFKDSDKKDRLKSGLKLNLDSDEFEKVWSKVRPRSFSSLNFGFGYYGDINPRHTSITARKSLLSALPSADIVRSCISRSLRSEDKPKFYDLGTGKALPLSRYWYRFGDIYTMRDHLGFFYKSDKSADNVSYDERSISSKLIAEKNYLREISKDLPSNTDLLYD